MTLTIAKAENGYILQVSLHAHSISRTYIFDTIDELSYWIRKNYKKATAPK